MSFLVDQTQFPQKRLVWQKFFIKQKSLLIFHKIFTVFKRVKSSDFELFSTTKCFFFSKLKPFWIIHKPVRWSFQHSVHWNWPMRSSATKPTDRTRTASQLTSVCWYYCAARATLLRKTAEKHPPHPTGPSQPPCSVWDGRGHARATQKFPLKKKERARERKKISKQKAKSVKSLEMNKSYLYWTNN